MIARLAGGAPSHAIKGIACMVGGGALVTLNDAVVKWLTAGYPVGEVLFIRSLFIVVPFSLLAWRFGGTTALRIHSFRSQTVRAAFALASTAFFVTSLSLLPLADTVAISFAGPLFVTALATPLLAERVGWRRWTAVAVGFAGVVLMVQPTGEAVRWAAMLPLAAALAGAFRDIITRRISFTESTVAMLCYSTLVVAVASLATLPFGWRLPDLPDLGWLALSGLLMGGGQYLTIEAFRLGEAALVAPFKYTNMVWAVLFGFLVWGHLPDRWTAAGSLLVIGSGLYILHRQTRAGVRERVGDPGLQIQGDGLASAAADPRGSSGEGKPGAPLGDRRS